MYLKPTSPRSMQKVDACFVDTSAMYQRHRADKKRSDLTHISCNNPKVSWFSTATNTPASVADFYISKIQELQRISPENSCKTKKSLFCG